MSRPTKHDHRLRRARRIRARIRGTAARPRMSVSRSLTRLSVQLIDDTTGRTLVSASSAEGMERKKGAKGRKGVRGKRSGSLKSLDAAKRLGALIAGKAKGAQIATVVFDRNAMKYHGRLKALADAAREGGLRF